MHKAVVTSAQLAADLPSGHAVGLMFGRESSGLTNGEVALASKILTIDADPSYPVLNLAQVCAPSLEHGEAGRRHPVVVVAGAPNTPNRAGAAPRACLVSGAQCA